MEAMEANSCLVAKVGANIQPDRLDDLVNKYDVILSWMAHWARKLYPHWQWATYADPRNYASTGFQSDVIAIKARQLRWAYRRVLGKRGIIMYIWLEDLWRLQSLTAYEKVDMLKANLHTMLQRAKIVPEATLYPSYCWMGRDELEFAVNASLA